MNSEMVGLVELRPFEPSDLAFVMATALRGLYYGNEYFKLTPKHSFMETYSKVISALLEKGTVVVACLKDQPDVILGYSLLSADAQTIHFIFVKKDWRLKGIGRALLPVKPVHYSHFTSLGLTLAPKLPNCTFDPFKL